MDDAALRHCHQRRILSTLREAADKDYRITVLSNACADGDEEVHRLLMTRVFPRQADVMHVADWADSDKTVSRL